MIAITVKPAKLAMKMLWNSFASCSVSPDNEPLLSSGFAMPIHLSTAIDRKHPCGVVAVTNSPRPDNTHPYHPRNANKT